MTTPFNLDLDPGEPTLRSERFHPGIFAPPIILFLVCFIPGAALIHAIKLQGVFPGSFFLLPLVAYGFILGLPVLTWFALAWFAYAKSLVILTNRRVLFRTGLLFRVAGELPLENVEGIILGQSLLGRVLGYGTVAVSTLGGRQYPLCYLGKPELFHAALKQAVQSAKAAPRAAKPPTATSAWPDDSRYMPKS